MSDYSSSSEFFFDELLRISSNLVWKNPTKARDNESPDNSIEVEQYILAVQGKLTFELVHKFDIEPLIEAGMDEETAILCSDNAFRIPEDLRDICVKKQIEYILSTYEEQNDYYRMLNGLPDKDDMDFVYNTEYPDICDDDVPIHTLSIDKLYHLESYGYLDKVIQENPTKEYLKHMTNKKIDFYTARNSSDYSILWISSSKYENLLNDFIETYNQCRNMVMAIYYQKGLESGNSEYVGFIGLMILFSTIINMNRKFLDADVSRDFYDEDSLRYVYDSYGVPYFSAIPVEFHKKIVKNMNILISHKGSTRVFYDIFDIFGFDSMSVFEYYLMKIHKFVDGKPYFACKEDGSYDLEKMYNIVFAKVRLYDDPTTEMSNTQNHVTYESITSPDPYWINDKDLIDKLYNEDYNYIESKYMGIQTTFNLMKIIYESSYFIKMILDNRQLLSTTVVYNNATHTDVNIFDIVIYLSALITRKYGFEGNIPINLHEIGKIMGFNFIEDMTVIKQNITTNDYLKNDTKLLDFLSNMTVKSLDSLKVVYDNLSSLRSYIMNKIAETDNVNTYWAYYNLYQTMMYSEYIQSTFVLSDGTTAPSFSELLKDINEDLYLRFMDEISLDINAEISDMLYLLKSSCASLKNIQYADNVNVDIIVEYMFKLLDFFSSAKTDLTSFETVYSLISASDNYYKLITVIDRINDDHTSDPMYSIIDELKDLLMICREKINLLDKFKLIDNMGNCIDKINLKDIIDYLEEKIIHISEVIYNIYESNDFKDYLSNIERTALPIDEVRFGDTINLLWDEVEEIIYYFVKDKAEINDIIFRIADYAKLSESDKLRFITSLTLADYYTHNDSEFSIRDNITSIKTKEKLISEMEFATLLSNVVGSKDKFKISSDATQNDIIKVVTEAMKVGLSNYQTDDSLTEEMLVLLYLDIDSNTLEYITNIVSEVTKSIINSNNEFNDKITGVAERVSKYTNGSLLMYESLDSHNRFKTGDTTATMSDSLIEVYSRTEE